MRLMVFACVFFSFVSFRIFGQDSSSQESRDKRVDISYGVLTDILVYLETRPFKEVSLLLSAVQRDAKFIGKTQSSAAQQPAAAPSTELPPPPISDDPVTDKNGDTWVKGPNGKMYKMVNKKFSKDEFDAVVKKGVKELEAKEKTKSDKDKNKKEEGK